MEGTELKGGEEATRKPSDDEPFSALAFKIMTAPQVGKLTYFRVYSGKLEKGSQILNTRTGNKERIGSSPRDARQQAGRTVTSP